MRAFIDTCSLFKKYAEESGSDELEGILRQVSEVTVSAIAWIEFNSVISRCLRERRMTPQNSSAVLSEAKKDFQAYSKVVWSDELEEMAAEAAHRRALSSLDAIQLAAGVLSKPDLFLTSDRRLFEEARKVIQGARYIG